MDSVAAATPVAEAAPSQRVTIALVPFLALFVFVWGEVIAQLKPEWESNPQYSYGWSVPFLAGFLLFKRWPLRPPSAPSSRSLALVLLMLGLFAFAPIRFVAEANPDWRLLSWALALVAVLVSLAAALFAGGLRWARHFAFPILFFLVAVPWPVLFEQSVIQGLMRAVTAINVAFLHLLGIPALRHGNVIEVGSGMIGIEEACSGVRSLQATLMISLFLGELYSFRLIRRIALIIAGGILAFLCNVVRTAILVWIGAEKGHEAIASWHDPAGLTILLVCLFGLWGISLLMSRDETPPGTPPYDSQVSLPRGAIAVCLALLTLMIASEAGVQLWYRAHRSAFETTPWSVNWPTAEPEYKSVPIALEAEGLLHYHDGGGATWRAGDDRQWLMYFFRWLPGQTAARFVKVHRPDICLPASGMTLVNDSGLRLINVNGINLPVRSYRFTNAGTNLHVFYCYWDARSSYENAHTAVEEDWSARGRVRAALRGQRDRGAQMLEVAVWGYEDDAVADEALRRRLSDIVRS